MSDIIPEEEKGACGWGSNILKGLDAWQKGQGGKGNPTKSRPEESSQCTLVARWRLRTRWFTCQNSIETSDWKELMRSVLVNGHVWHEDERRRKSLWLSLQFLWSFSALISAPVVRWWADAARWLVWKPSRISVQRDDLPQNSKGRNHWNLNRAEAPSMDCLVSHTYQICSSALQP